MTSNAIKFPQSGEYERPHIFAYQDYKAFLRDYFHYMKIGDPDFSTRSLAARAKISNGYISTVLNSKQEITGKALAKIIPHLKLDATETSYLKLLCKLSMSATQEERIEAVRKMQNYKEFAKVNPQEALVLNYFTKWYYIAIREMANLPDFQINAKWIHEKLNFAVPISEVSKALEFLIQNQLIRIRPDGSFASGEGRIECEGNIYRFILTHFHKQFFELAAQSIDNTSRDLRSIKSHTIALTAEQYQEAKKLMDAALEGIAKLVKSKDERGTIHHFMFLGFPLTKPDNESDT